MDEAEGSIYNNVELICKMTVHVEDHSLLSKQLPALSKR